MAKKTIELEPWQKWSTEETRERAPKGYGILDEYKPDMRTKQNKPSWDAGQPKKGQYRWVEARPRTSRDQGGSANRSQMRWLERNTDRPAHWEIYAPGEQNQRYSFGVKNPRMGKDPQQAKEEGWINYVGETYTYGKDYVTGKSYGLTTWPEARGARPIPPAKQRTGQVAEIFRGSQKVEWNPLAKRSY